MLRGHNLLFCCVIVHLGGLETLILCVSTLQHAVLAMVSCRQARFVRGYSREKDPQGKMLEMVDKALEWRVSAKVDECLLHDMPKTERFFEVWPCMLHGCDIEGM